MLQIEICSHSLVNTIASPETLGLFIFSEINRVGTRSYFSMTPFSFPFFFLSHSSFFFLSLWPDRPTDPLSRERGRWETKQLIGMAFRKKNRILLVVYLVTASWLLTLFKGWIMLSNGQVLPKQIKLSIG